MSGSIWCVDPMIPLSCCEKITLPFSDPSLPPLRPTRHRSPSPPPTPACPWKYHTQSTRAPPLRSLRHSSHSRSQCRGGGRVVPAGRVVEGGRERGGDEKRGVFQQKAWGRNNMHFTSTLTSRAKSSIARAVISLWMPMMREELLYLAASCLMWCKWWVIMRSMMVSVRGLIEGGHKGRGVM